MLKCLIPRSRLQWTIFFFFFYLHFTHNQHLIIKADNIPKFYIRLNKDLNEIKMLGEINILSFNLELFMN